MWWTLPRAEGSTLHGSAPQSPSGCAQAAGGLCLRGSRLGRPLLGKTDPPALDSARPLLANALLEPGERRGVACPSAKVTFGHSPVAVTTSEEALGDSGRERRCSPWSQPFPEEQGGGGALCAAGEPSLQPLPGPGVLSRASAWRARVRSGAGSWAGPVAEGAGSEGRPVSARPPDGAQPEAQRGLSSVSPRGCTCFEGCPATSGLHPAGAVTSRAAFRERCSFAPQRQACLFARSSQGSGTASFSGGRDGRPLPRTVANMGLSLEDGATRAPWPSQSPWLSRLPSPLGTAAQRPEHRKGRGLALAHHPETPPPGPGPPQGLLAPARQRQRGAHVLAPVALLARRHLQCPEAQLASGTAALSPPGLSPLLPTDRAQPPEPGAPWGPGDACKAQTPAKGTDSVSPDSFSTITASFTPSFCKTPPTPLAAHQFAVIFFLLFSQDDLRAAEQQGPV